MKKINTSEDTSKFYDDLMKGKSVQTFFTKDSRFNVKKLLEKKNVQIYFDEVVKHYINSNDVILDYGCGPGTFLIKMSKLTKNKLFGVDLSEEFIKECKENIEDLKIQNISVSTVQPEKLPFANEQFDTILLMDVIHHLDDINQNLKEIHRVLKKDGKLIVFEPNKLNPLIWLTHLIDKNERGLLNVGTLDKYNKILNNFHLKIIHHRYSGIVIGPSSKIFDLLSSILNYKLIYPILGWFNPKIMLVAKK